MKGLFTIAVAGMLSYNTLGAYDTLRSTVSSITDVYQAAYNINFFAPDYMRAEQEKHFLEMADKRIAPIAKASETVASRDMEPNEIIFNFGQSIQIN